MCLVSCFGFEVTRKMKHGPLFKTRINMVHAMDVKEVCFFVVF